MLKTCAPQLAPANATIFQASIDTGKLSSDWMNANIAPAYKKGDVHISENYRLVSLTCVSCKILEHIICKHLLDHLERNNILTSLKHGFRFGYSCETVLELFLFLCHINDVPDSVKSTIRLFADDCLLYRQIKSVKDIPLRNLSIQGFVSLLKKKMLSERYTLFINNRLNKFFKKWTSVYNYFYPSTE